MCITPEEDKKDFPIDGRQDKTSSNLKAEHSLNRQAFLE